MARVGIRLLSLSLSLSLRKRGLFSAVDIEGEGRRTAETEPHSSLSPTYSSRLLDPLKDLKCAASRLFVAQPLLDLLGRSGARVT